MDNGGFQRDVEEGTELGLVKNAERKTGKTIANSSRFEPSTSCRTEVCQSARRRFHGPELSDGPWHKSKTIALTVTIILFITWIIVYTVLSQMNLL